MYDKQARVLRIETTTNDVSVFKHHREVKHRDGTRQMKYASVKKTIYSLGAVAELMQACNKRYLSFISQWRDHSRERTDLRKITDSVKDDKDRSYRGVNFFQSNDLSFLLAIMRGEYQISGFTNRSLQTHLLGWSSQKNRPCFEKVPSTSTDQTRRAYLQILSFIIGQKSTRSSPTIERTSNSAHYGYRINHAKI